MSAKIISLQQLSSICLSDQKIVLTTGVFDLIHQAHKQFLKLAKLTADILIVGIESDLRVHNLKGNDRPIETSMIRAKHLSRLDDVDFVFVLPEDFGKLKVREKLIKLIKPDIYAVSSHSPNLPQKKLLIEKYGGEIRIVMNKDETISTTQILKSYNN